MVELSTLATGDLFLAPGVAPGTTLVKAHGNGSTVEPSPGFVLVYVVGAARVIELAGTSQVTPYPHPLTAPVVI